MHFCIATKFFVTHFFNLITLTDLPSGGLGGKIVMKILQFGHFLIDAWKLHSSCYQR